MNHAVALGLLFFGTACELVCVVGVLWFADAFDQLHYSAAASTVGVVAIAVAAVLTGMPSLSGTIDCVIALGLLLLLNPVMTSLTGRAVRLSRAGTLTPTRAEYRNQP